MAQREAKAELLPDEQPLTKRRAQWLAQETGLARDELLEKPLRDLHESLRFRIDPQLLLFRKICGRVVKRDPVTGEDAGVPNATVHVEDVDFSFFAYYPQTAPYWWLWPFHVTREEIGHVRTDPCGRFCVWVPRWDIDRILRLRRKLVCEPVLPNLTDLIHNLREIEWPPKPFPEPGPLRELDPQLIRRAREELGPEVADRLAAAAGPEAVSSGARAELLAAPAFSSPPPPPLPKDTATQLRKLDHPALEEARLHGLEELDVESFVGPFLRCHLEWYAEWQTFVDVPDIAFRVTQDVDGDGDEETVYSEGFFDVRWDAGPIPDVTLQAAPTALAADFCGGSGEARECKGKPKLYAVGTMPLDTGYHDAGTGYALRVNRPRSGGVPSGAPFEPARSPYARRLALMACHRLPGATHQRVMYRTAGLSQPVPLFVPTWYAATTPGQPTPVVPFSQDAQGWIPIRPAGTLAIPDWVLHWPTPPSGRYALHVECGDGSGNLVGSAGDEVAFTVDNVPCHLAFGQLRWRAEGSGGWQALPASCPVIRRPQGTAIELEVPWSADSPHFRDASLTFSGCEATSPSAIAADSPPITHRQWHDSVFDTHGGDTAFYTVTAGKPDGAYTLDLSAWTRATHPGFDAGPNSDFRFDQNVVWSHIRRVIAIVDECP